MPDPRSVNGQPRPLAGPRMDRPAAVGAARPLLWGSARSAGPWLRVFRRESANSPQDSQPRPFTANETQRHRKDVYAGQAHFPARARNAQRQPIRLLVVRALLRHLISTRRSIVGSRSVTEENRL